MGSIDNRENNRSGARLVEVMYILDQTLPLALHVISNKVGLYYGSYQTFAEATL